MLVKGEVFIQANWPIRSELIPVQLGVLLFTPPPLPTGWDATMQYITGFPPALSLLVLFYTPVWRVSEEPYHKRYQCKQYMYAKEILVCVLGAFKDNMSYQVLIH